MSVREKRSLLSTLAKEPRKKITKSKNKNSKCGEIFCMRCYTMANKITEREIYTSILNGTADQSVLCEFAEKKLAQLDKRNASAKVRAERKRAEGDAVTEGIFGVLTAEPMTRGQVAEAFGSELSVAKVGARLTKLFNEGRIQKETIKVAGEDGKMKNAVAYFVAE